MQDAIEAANKLGLNLQPESEAIAEQVIALRATVELTPEKIELLHALWNDPAIKTVIESHTELLTVTHFGYFWEHINRVILPDFSPNDEDIIRARVRTAGANSSSIFIDRRYFEFYDVGGQKPERAKWQVVLSENKFTTIIYFVAADEFDVENEDQDTNRTKMEISRFIFSELVNSQMVDENCPIVLFLNRTDLFEIRMNDPEGFQSFQDTFPDYFGGKDYEKGLEHLLELFLSSTRKHTNMKHYFTCALDRDSLVTVWRIVKESLLIQTFKVLGF